MAVAVIWAVTLSSLCPTARAQTADEQLRAWRRKRPYVLRIDVEGNRALSDGRVRSLMQIRAPGLWGSLGLRKKTQLLTDAEERDQTAIRRAYRQAGFWDARVSISAAPDREDKGALVTVFIDEGMRYHWGHVELHGDDPGLVTRGNRLAHTLALGATADSLQLAAVVEEITAACSDLGHPRASVDVAVRAQGDTLNVTLALSARSPVVLGALAIEGTQRTHENIVRREIEWQPGTLYSQKRLAWRQQDLYATGMFTLVRLEPMAVDSTRIRDTLTSDFRLRVIERKPSYVGFGTGAGQDPDRDLTWDYSLEWGSRNWLGTGRQWSLTARSGFVVITDWRVLHHRFTGKYTEPWIFGMRLPTTLTLSYEPGVRSTKQDYRVETATGELNVTRRVGRTSRWWSSLILERVVIYGIPTAQQEAFLQEKGINVKRRWTLAFEHDTRPNLFVPTGGSRTRIDAQYVGGILGGSTDFYKIDMQWSRYQVVSAPTVLATRFRFGWANTHSGGTFIPTIDRFYLGGASSVRGYAENTVGPVDSLGIPVGGRVVTLANVELRTPVTGPFWFTLFLDAGNNFDNFHRLSLSNMLVSLGIGWEYVAPVGPIRLDYARRAVHPQYPASDRLHLSILFSF